MFGVDGRADVILESFVEEERNGSLQFEIEPECPDALYYSQLRQAGLIDAKGSAGCDVVLVQGVTVAGRGHAQKVRQAKMNAGFPMLSLKDDALLRECYKIMNKDGNIGKEIMCERNSKALDRLQKERLIDVLYADNRPYVFQGITKRGIKYVEDMISEGKDMNINVSPIFNNENTINNETMAVASASSTVTISSVIKAIDASSLGDQEKRDAKNALEELEEAAESKDSRNFFGALEKISGIAKNVVDFGSSLIPLIAKLGGNFG